LGKRDIKTWEMEIPRFRSFGSESFSPCFDAKWTKDQGSDILTPPLLETIRMLDPTMTAALDASCLSLLNTSVSD
jgi:hypothetical protein